MLDLSILRHLRPSIASISTPGSRSFTSSSTTQTNRSRIEILHSKIPAYPYGPSRWYKQSNNGLYGGTHIHFGNIVSERENKTRRRWKPNIHKKRLWSVALDRFVRVKVSTRALRTIDKSGGLDEYLLGDKPSRIRELGMGGWLLRWRIRQTPLVKQRYADERQRLGLPPLVEDGPDAAVEGGQDAIREGILEIDGTLDEAERKAAETGEGDDDSSLEDQGRSRLVS
ncbi:MAG: hypothetical protein M1825_002865 [Sarcosagium campestre]|nr:MAG: hypothetical protein M1825_002865 [Sarcosagium campestre]